MSCCTCGNVCAAACPHAAGAWCCGVATCTAHHLANAVRPEVWCRRCRTDEESCCSCGSPAPILCPATCRHRRVPLELCDYDDCPAWAEHERVVEPVHVPPYMNFSAAMACLAGARALLRRAPLHETVTYLAAREADRLEAALEQLRPPSAWQADYNGCALRVAELRVEAEMLSTNVYSLQGMYERAARRD
jgi:hypothetical protein